MQIVGFPMRRLIYVVGVHKNNLHSLCIPVAFISKKYEHQFTNTNFNNNFTNIGHIFSPFTYMCLLHYSQLIMDVVHLNIHRFVESFEYS